MTAALPRKLLATGAVVLALPALGAVAYAAAHAVSNNPAPQRVLPIDSRSRVDDTTETTDTTEDARGREAEPGDDRGHHTVVSTPASTPTTARVSEHGPNHDVGDDHGGDRTATTNVTVEDNSGSGSSNSGSGSSNSGRGSDDSHQGSDDSGRHGSDGELS